MKRMREITVSLEIFSPKTIRTAIRAYSGLAAIAAKESSNQVCLTFSSCRYDENRTVKEFENYLIGIEHAS